MTTALVEAYVGLGRTAAALAERYAAALFLSPKTVERHLASVFRKRGFRSRTERAVAFATAAEPSSRTGKRDQGVSGLGWSSPSTQMSARSL